MVIIIDHALRDSFNLADCSQYSDDFSDCEEGGPPNPARGNMIRRIKIARQKAINKRIEETLTKADLVKEKMYAQVDISTICPSLSMFLVSTIFSGSRHSKWQRSTHY